MIEMSKSDKDTMSRSDRKKQKKQKPKKRGLWKKILLGLVGLLLAGLVAGAGLFAFYAARAPEITQEDLTGNYNSEYLDINGKVFFTTGGEDREYASFEDYPEVMLNALMATEDQRFLSHIGIDPIGIGRAALGYVVNREIVGGGSTITQQLIKNSVFSTLEEDQTLERKAQEAWLAIQLEQELSKEQIMTFYLNKIHMGDNVYGVYTAAKEYYGKHVSELELHEAAMLAGMPKAPNYYNPYQNPEAAESRRWVVLESMVSYGAITQAEADAAKEIPVTENLQERTPDPDSLIFDAYRQVVEDEVREKTDFNVDTAGLTVYTNYDPEAQELMFDVANSDNYVNFPNNGTQTLQTAMTLIDSTTGQIRGLISGRERDGALGTNYVSQLERAVGSTIKPLSTYGPAIEFLQYSTYHQVYDEPTDFGNWEVGNYDLRHKGQMSMREALVDSRNVPTAKLFTQDLANYQSEVSQFMENMGINIENLNSSGVLERQNAINGTMTPLELAGAYTAFANDGTYTEPYAVTKIVTQQGQEIDLTPSSNKVMEDYTAYMVNDMLKGVINHYSSSLTIPGYTHAAKTGTSNYEPKELQKYGMPADAVPDNWVVGYSPHYTMSVWVGYEYDRREDGYLTHADGSRSIARYIYQAAMSRLVEGLEPRDWQRPNSVVEHAVVNGSNPALLANGGSSSTVNELFVRGNEPSQREEPEVEVSLSAPSGLNASYISDTDEVAVSWDAFLLPAGADGNADYILTINGGEQVVSGTEYLISDPPRGVLNISLAVQYNGDTSPTTTVQVDVPNPDDEIEEEEPEEPDPEPEEIEPDPEPEEPDSDEPTGTDPEEEEPGSGEGQG